MTTRPFVRWYPQFGGSAYHGELLHTVMWLNHDTDESVEVALIRYWCKPGGDMPRKPYTLIEVSRLEWLSSLPEGFVPMDGPLP